MRLWKFKILYSLSICSVEVNADTSYTVPYDIFQRSLLIVSYIIPSLTQEQPEQTAEKEAQLKKHAFPPISCRTMFA